MVIAIIPARGGSKGVPKKNLRDLEGYPLIAYSIAACTLSEKIDRVIVSTDSQEIADVSRSFGAEVPFMRPAEISGDKSTDIEFMLHAISWFKENEGFVPEHIAHVRPTTPLRDPALIDAAIDKILSSKDATSLRSVHELRESPYKLFGINGDFLEGLYPDDPRPEYYNLPRQTFPPVYQPNGYIDVVKSKTILEMNKLHGHQMLSFITPDVGEVDNLEDFDYIEYILQTKEYEILDFLKKNY
ncbi:acylneuraminate cytidylyltransferase family protein [Methanolobus sp. WCC1]|uniref:acylneuraminate cytidylyltransferase family protein n=1 Tax=unclassified Methanolobus TaxID=2629569 RepID=UPI00324C488E